MSKRGIMQHGLVKTFLTRGAFRSVFKPLLYKTEDHIHHDFLMTFVPLANGINYETGIGKFVLYWLYNVPKELFEEVFIAGDNGNAYLNAVKDSDLKNGNLCAHYTQAFTIWHLEQLLKKSVEFRDTVGLSIEDIEDVLTEFYGAKNLTLQYLTEIRQQFNLETMAVDPRDWGIIYVHTIYDLLINNEHKKYLSLNVWDKDILQKMSFIEFVIQFFADKKVQSINLFNS